MSGQPVNPTNAAPAPKEIVFKCKFCGQTKAFSELVLLRQYYPQLASCRDCAKGKPVSE